MSSEESKRSAIVTGAASGIGREIARGLVRDGFAAILVDVANMQELTHELSAVGGTVTAVRGDVATEHIMATACERAMELGELSFAALNAGVLTGEADITKVDARQYQRVISANIDGVVRGLQALLRAVDGRSLSVVVTSSSVGLVPAPHDPLYSMSKHAVVGLVRCMAMSPLYRHMRINCICPNGVDTPMLGTALKEGRTLLTAEDVARRVLELFHMGGSGDAWVCTPSIFEPFEFGPNPGYSFPAFATAGE